ncbi:MAG: ABC transporter ATP-binding protein [Desulfovibrio sp.]|jgi:branched-chain amino acid transport system ATP-binding protein|nr:ABC transporter ATP-binding protein [Desulfovibrio sp.]
MLEVREVHAGYGKTEVLRGVSLSVKEGSIVALVGANGAGKTTIMAAITGHVPVSSGQIRFQGENIAGIPAHQVVVRGISLVPEGRQVVSPLSVEENLFLGAHTRGKKEAAESLDRVFSWFPRLRERRAQKSGSLSGGEQQMLAIGRAMMAKPKLLLLDEPSMGLAPLVVSEVFRFIRKLNEEGTTVFLGEQNARKALGMAEYAYVLEDGELIMEGPARRLLSSEQVVEAYLGGAGDGI